jgi:sec-independent protein translocase protein TatB
MGRVRTRPMIGGLSMTEVIIILGLALLLLGPDQLPTLAKSIGKGLREIRKATDDLKGQFEQEVARLDLNEPPHRMIAPVPSAPAAETPTAETPAADDPAAARASARIAASTPPAADDPAGARAAARRAAESDRLKLVPPEGTVARDAEPKA